MGRNITVGVGCGRNIKALWDTAPPPHPHYDGERAPPAGTAPKPAKLLAGETWTFTGQPPGPLATILPPQAFDWSWTGWDGGLDTPPPPLTSAPSWKTSIRATGKRQIPAQPPRPQDPSARGSISYRCPTPPTTSGHSGGAAMVTPRP